MLSATVVSTLGAVPAQAGTAGMQRRYLRIINHSREAHDLKPLRLQSGLTDDAMRHTRKMVRRGRLFDPRNLYRVLSPYRYEIGGDIVGCGSSLTQIQRLFMHHAEHRSIILNAKMRRVGIGPMTVDGRSSCGRDTIWLTAILYG